VIGKGDLITKLQDQTGYKKKDLQVVLESLIDVIRADVLEGGSEIRIRDFGTFKQKNLEARTGRNPKTGEPLNIGKSSTVSFSPSDSGLRVRYNH
jgi:DNA-binding protein HU-beta